jgi:hypothetical protein
VKALEVKKKYDANKESYDAKMKGYTSSINQGSLVNQSKNPSGYPTTEPFYQAPPQANFNPGFGQQPQQAPYQAKYESSIVFPKPSAINKIQDDRYQKVFPSNISSSQVKRNFSNKVDLSKIVSLVS